MDGGSGLGGGNLGPVGGRDPGGLTPSVWVLNSSSFFCSWLCVGEGDLSRLGVATTEGAGDFALLLSLAPPKPPWSLRLPPVAPWPLPSALTDPAELLRALVVEKGLMRKLPTSPNLTDPLGFPGAVLLGRLLRPLSLISRGGPWVGILSLSKGIVCSKPNSLLLLLCWGSSSARRVTPVTGSTVVVPDITVPPAGSS